MLLKHVNDLLDMSKIEARKLKIDLQDTDVAALVRFLASHFAVLAADRQIEYAVDADGPCVAAIDPDKLQRVVMNLLGNAFKFVPDGGRIRCSLRHSAAEITIAVDDSGPGVRARAAAGDFRALPAGRRRHQPNASPAPAWAWRSRRSSSRCTRGGSTCSTPTLAAHGSR